MARKRSTRSRKKGGSKKRKSGIRINPANKGKLRKTAKTKKGQKMSVAKLRQLKKSKNPKTRQRANFALNAKTKFKKGGGKKKKKRRSRRR